MPGTVLSALGNAKMNKSLVPDLQSSQIRYVKITFNTRQKRSTYEMYKKGLGQRRKKFFLLKIMQDFVR